MHVEAQEAWLAKALMSKPHKSSVRTIIFNLLLFINQGVIDCIEIFEMRRAREGLPSTSPTFSFHASIAC